MNGMNGMIARSVALAGILATAVSLTSFAGETKKPAASGTPVVTDWSHSHLIFSQPRTPEQAARVQKDIRYQQQQARHTAHPEATLRTGEEESKSSRLRFWRRHHRRAGRRMHRDWSVDLGPGATVGPDRFPAKYSFSILSASCASVFPSIPDFVVYNTGKTGTEANIVALTNLYSGCGGQFLKVKWAYETLGQVLTSPIISFDGKQIAYVQTTGTAATLVLLKWNGFEGDTIQVPGHPIPALATAYPTCAAPCMTTFPLIANDTNSSVYYNYGTDVLWVGDDSGKLHQFTGVFKGTPAEATAPFPVSVSTTALTSAIDDGSGTIFVEDKGGFLYRVDGAGTVTKSAQLDFGTGFTEAPIVDSTAGSVYAFSSKDGATSATAGVFQLSTAFAAGDTGPEVTLGAATAGTTPMYAGTFDHDYVTGAAPTGNFYVCGNPGSFPTLYQVPIVNNVMGTPVAGPIVSTTGSAICSPVTDVYNATVTGAGLPQEWVFLSTQGPGFVDECGGVSCIMNFKVTPWQPNFVYNIGQEVLDSNLNIEVAENSGFTSGATPPVWGTGVYAPTNDNGVHWRNQGPLLSTPPNAPWAVNTAYGGAAEVIDANNNIQIAQPTGGTSGGTQPTWALGEGDTTPDNGITWINLGRNPVAGLSASGGTSGIIMDNTIESGGSQVYFTNLQDFPCEFGATGGCAVQASQQDLN